MKSLLAAYEKAGLKSHPTKLEFGVEVTTKWGVELNGLTGKLRTPPLRVIFLSAVTLEIVRLRLMTVQLLESLVGSWIAVFLHRRRVLCVIDLAFEAMRGRQPTDVLAISPRLCAELLS